MNRQVNARMANRKPFDCDVNDCTISDSISRFQWLNGSDILCLLRLHKW